jgi:hypothetical protein
MENYDSIPFKNKDIDLFNAKNAEKNAIRYAMNQDRSEMKEVNSEMKEERKQNKKARKYMEQ